MCHVGLGVRGFVIDTSISTGAGYKKKEEKEIFLRVKWKEARDLKEQIASYLMIAPIFTLRDFRLSVARDRAMRFRFSLHPARNFSTPFASREALHSRVFFHGSLVFKKIFMLLEN